MRKLFGSEKRKQQRAKEARDAAMVATNTRANLQEALQEVLRSHDTLCLHVGNKHIGGKNGVCAIQALWFDASFFMRDVEYVQSLLGAGFDVAGTVPIATKCVPLSVAAEGLLFQAPRESRTYAISYKHSVVELRTLGELQPYKGNLDPFRTPYIRIRSISDQTPAVK